MQKKKLAERGALMVEMVAVVAVLGVMGTVLFRQMNQRNQELDNINMASEIRTVKEATMAYIQANRPSLEANCVLDGDYGYMTLANEEIDYFMPDNWASNRDGNGAWKGDGIINEYGIYLTCYEIDSELAPRKALYATIIPHDWALPEGFTLRRASRVANLIGADGGVYTDGALHGTMGAWEVWCPFDSDGDVCDEREDNFFVATTGVDIYIPEVEDAPDNAVVVPDSIAFERLHSTNYFSVGDGNANCVGNMTPNGEFAHKAIDPDSGVPSGTADEIRNVGTADCEPLFWVGTRGLNVDTDNSEARQVYVKNNLYVGRDNATNTHAVAIETGDDDTERSVTVFSANGDERLMLDATGKVVGRSGAGGKGYRLDAENGEIVLFEEKTVGEKVIQVPTMRLKDGVMRTDRTVTYTGAGETPVTDTYKVDPAFTSLMNDIRLTSRGGARLSDILPNYITKAITSRTFDSGEFKEVDKPACPGGYVRAIMVTPVSWSQYITEAELRLPAVPAGSATPAITLSDTNPTEKDIDVINNDARLRLQHQEPVRITINNGDSWSVLADYSGTAATNADPISVVAQTYCVFDKDNFGGAPGTSGGLNGNGLGQEEGTEGQEISPKDRNCSENADCDNTEKCSTAKVCVSLGSCTADDTAKKLYCIDGRYVYVECTEDAECDEEQTCQNNRCKGGKGATSA